MTDELVCDFTQNKTKDTEKFRDSKISNIFYKAARKCPLFRGPENKEVYKQTMLQVFKSTKQRYRNKLKTSNELPTKESLNHALQNITQALEHYEESEEDVVDDNQSNNGEDSEYDDL